MIALQHGSPQGCSHDGMWHPCPTSGVLHAPSNLSHTIGPTVDGSDAIDDIVASARRASTAWRRVPLDARVEVMEHFIAVLNERVDEHAAWITTEIGKPLRESRAEAEALARKAAISIDIARAELRRHHAASQAGWYDLAPLGVIAVLGPFNFPMHLSNGHVVPALLAGNAVVLKPSEFAPLCGERYVLAWQEACRRAGSDLAAAALGLLPGAGDAGAKLVAHADVDGVGFTGSWEVGVAIRRATVEQTGKLLALEMGGRNASLVRADADLDRAAAQILESVLWSAGQRCTATSRVIAHAAVAGPLRDRLAAGIEAARPSNPCDPTTVLGPLATAKGRERFEHAGAPHPGVVRIAESRLDASLPQGHWVRPRLDEVLDASAAHARLEPEVFGPELLLERAADDDEMVARANATPWGLAASIYTGDEGAFERLLPEVRAGVINWNRPTIGASSELPFGGTGRSGNHRPVGSWAIRNSTRAVATLVGERE